MKIVLTVEVEVDPEVWAGEYAPGAGDRFIREDVKTHMTHSLEQHFGRAGMGVVISVTRR